MNKPAVIRAIRAALQTELDHLVHSTEAALSEATGEESHAENKYDTRALEASYLAGGQTERLLALKKRIAWFDVLSTGDLRPNSPVQAGALVQVEEDEIEWWCFVAPEGGGLKVKVDGVDVTVIGPDAPIGRALLGSKEDDDVLVRTHRGDRELAVLSVR